MPRYCQLVLGPAGSGKSTYCSSIIEHMQVSKRRAHVVNLDPAAEHFSYPVLWDVRDVISVDDVAEALDFGPNGSLVYSMEFFLNNIETLDEALGEFDDDYLLFDCPGQIELYTHLDVMRKMVDHLKLHDYRVAAVYLLDSQFMDDPFKFFSGTLSAMATMLQLEVPHINVMSKMDLVRPSLQRELESYLDPDPQLLLSTLNSRTARRQHGLNAALASLVEDFSLVKFVPYSKDDEDSVGEVLQQLDLCLQYGEEEEPQEPQDLADEDDDGDDTGFDV